MPHFDLAHIEVPPERRGGYQGARRAWSRHTSASGAGLLAHDAERLYRRWWRFALHLARGYCMTDPEHAPEIAAEAWVSICGRSAPPRPEWERRTIVQEVYAAAHKHRIMKLARECASLDALAEREASGRYL